MCTRPELIEGFERSILQQVQDERTYYDCIFSSEQSCFLLFTSFVNSCATYAIILSQSPGVGCLNKRTLGYQGVSVLSCIQRQSAGLGSIIHVGIPSAAAAWPIEVSTVITRSRFLITAIVSINLPLL